MDQNKARVYWGIRRWIEIRRLVCGWNRSKPEPVRALEGRSGALRKGLGWIEWNPDPLNGLGLDRIS